MQGKANVPAIRFAGFTDAWERRKFFELYERVSQKNDLTFGKDEIISVANMYFKPDSYITDPEYLRTYNVFRLGDIAFEGNRSKNFAHGRFVENTIGDGIVSHVFDVFRPITQYDLLFWKYAINNERIMGRILLRSTKSSTMMTNLVANDFLQESICVPTLAEQQRIGVFFRHLDHLITLHQCKYSRLCNIKKSMLEKMFPKEGASVPEIRFAGFTDAWEQRKLGGLVQFSKGTGYSKADLKEKGTPIILYGRLYTKYETVISDVDTYADSRDGSVYSRGGEVIVPASGETAEDISVASVVEKPGILLGGDLNIITPPADLDPAFLAISISNGKPHDDMAKMAQGKSVVHLHNADLEKIDFMYPCYTEQMQISTYFKNLDHLITLHQRELERLQNIKKACLEKMFV